MAAPVMAVLADDLTGAADAGLVFARAGIPAAVYLRRPSTVATPVAVAAAATRSGPARRARALTAAAMDWVVGLGPAAVYKKIDSFLRGFPAVEVEVCRAALPHRVTVIAPAAPALGRQTMGGVQLFRGQPLEQTEAGRDPVAPVRTSRLAELFGSVHIGLGTVARGPAAVATAVERALALGHDVLSFDAACASDLEAVVAGIGDRPALWVGSVGLLGPLAGRLAAAGATAPLPRLPVRCGPVLVVAGSVSEITGAQLRALAGALGDRLVRVQVAPGGGEAAAGAAAAGAAAAAALAAGNCAALVPALTPGGPPDPVAARAVADALARAAATALSLCRKVGGLILTGGDTALAVCRRVGVEALAQLGEPAPAVPLSVVRGGRLAGWPVITKGGAVGHAEDLITCLRFLTEPEPPAYRDRP